MSSQQDELSHKKCFKNCDKGFGLTFSSCSGGFVTIVVNLENGSSRLSTLLWYAFSWTLDETVRFTLPAKYVASFTSLIISIHRPASHYLHLFIRQCTFDGSRLRNAGSCLD